MVSNSESVRNPSGNSSGWTKKSAYSSLGLNESNTFNVSIPLIDTEGYTYYAVSYESNGGTNTIPDDNTPYSIGKNVTVLFNTVPTREGYVFLGWSEDKNADEATYTQDGKKTFVMKDEDVVLYAVWAENVCVDHKFVATVTKPATCTTDGVLTKTCEREGCGYYVTEVIPATGHSLSNENIVKEATCTEL